MKKRRNWRTTVVGLILTAIMLFPIYWMINVSLTPKDKLRADPPPLFPWHPNFEGYAKVIHEQFPYLATSFLVGIGTVIVVLVVAAPAGYALAKLRPRGGATLTFGLLVAQMIPGIIMAMGFYLIFHSWGLLNTVWGLIIADSTLAVPFGVLIFTAFMIGIPDEIIQAARIDGAGYWRTFRSVVLPVSRNSIVTVSLFAFLVVVVGLLVLLDAQPRRRPADHHHRHLPVPGQQHAGLERDHGHRRSRLHSRRVPARHRAALRGRGRDRRRGKGLNYSWKRAL